MVAAVAALPLAPSRAVQAETVPPSGTPATVSADALPTVQINGVVWAQVTVGNTVYATGSFSSARPAGSPSGSGETPRANLLAYDITSGSLLPFNHSLNGQGRAIAASPDGTRLYVGGDFTNVDGVAHNHLAAFDIASGALVSSFTAGPNGSVRALAASNSMVYVGGNFTTVSGGTARTRLAAYTSAGALSAWAPAANSNVAAMVLTTDATKVVVGGSFSRLNTTTYHSLGAVNATTGVLVPWASQSDAFPVRVDRDGAGITSLSTDGAQIYLTAYNFNNRAAPGGFEGRAAISSTDGRLVWLNDCHGDSYSAFPVGQVLYSTGHAHDCQPAGAFPQVAGKWYRALAETTYATGVNGAPTNGYTNYQGVTRSSQLAWYPALAIGAYTGQSQAAWSVTGNADYISLGGEFPRVNGVAQQGLVRFAVQAHAPNRSGPVAYAAPAVTKSAATSSGATFVGWPATWDRDNGTLTYRLYRDAGTTPIYTTSVNSRFWISPVASYVDRVAGNSSHTYRLVVSDPFGNTTATTAATGHTVVANWTNNFCADASRACATYFMQIRRDSAGRHYGWSSVMQSPGQSATKAQIVRAQIDRINLGLTTVGVVATVGPVNSGSPSVYAGTPAVTVSTPARLRERLYLSLRFSDGSVRSFATGLLVYGQRA